MDFTTEPRQPHEIEEGSLGATVAKAFIYFAKLIALICLCPWGFWVAATRRLAKLRDTSSIFSFMSKSRWPFFSFIKKLLFDFVFDGAIFISYFVGAIYCIIYFIMGWKNGNFLTGVGILFATLVGTYVFPLTVSIVRDVITILILPFRKFLNWCEKPAQYMDLNVTKKDVTK